MRKYANFWGSIMRAPNKCRLSDKFSADTGVSPLRQILKILDKLGIDGH